MKNKSKPNANSDNSSAPRSHPRGLVLLGAVLGLIVCSGPVLQFTFGIFLKPVAEALQTDRGMLSAALFAGLACNGMAVPFFGWLVDRYGIARITYPAIIMSGLLTMALGLLPQSALGFIVCYALLGVAFAGQTPLPYACAVTSAFTHRRGLALGVAMSGVGIGTALLPQVSQYFVSLWDWRYAYVVLGAVIVSVGVPAVWLLGPQRKLPLPELSQLTSHNPVGLSAAQSVRCVTFWLMAGAFFWVTMAASGIAAHFVPFMTDSGIETRVAAQAIGITGLSVIAGRLLAGWLLDRFFAPYVAMAFFAVLLCAAIILLSTTALPLLLIAALFLGFGLGGEVDIIAYFVSRYFGLQAFGQIYGYLWATFMLGGALGPLVMGASFSIIGSYESALWFFVGILTVAIFLVSRLGDYTFSVSLHEQK